MCGGRGGGGEETKLVPLRIYTRVGVLGRLTLGATLSCKRDALMTAWQEDGVGWDKGVGGGGEEDNRGGRVVT